MLRAAWGGAILAISALFAWQFLKGKGDNEIIASGNGRIEATETDVAAKLAGRIKAILVEEGEFVTAGQMLAQMDTEVLQAQLRQAEAQGRRAQSQVVTACSRLAQREREIAAAQAVVVQR
jgi:HlyD family secretion protein